MKEESLTQIAESGLFVFTTKESCVYLRTTPLGS